MKLLDDYASLGKWFVNFGVHGHLRLLIASIATYEN